MHSTGRLYIFTHVGLIRTDACPDHRPVVLTRFAYMYIFHSKHAVFGLCVFVIVAATRLLKSINYISKVF